MILSSQLIAALIVNLAALSSGLSLGFSAIALPQLKGNLTENPDLYQPFHLNMESGSWVASIFGIGAIFGGFATAYLGSKFGRRRALMMMAIPDAIGWILIAASQNIPMILIGRFLSGFCAAGYSPSIQVSVFFKKKVFDFINFNKMVAFFPFYLNSRYWTRTARVSNPRVREKISVPGSPIYTKN